MLAKEKPILYSHSGSHYIIERVEGWTEKSVLKKVLYSKFSVNLVYHYKKNSKVYLLYAETSIFGGSSEILTSKRPWTELRTSESSCDDTKVMANPLVPNLPARPTYEKWMYIIIKLWSGRKLCILKRGKMWVSRSQTFHSILTNWKWY